jgi:hypothetical protein
VLELGGGWLEQVPVLAGEVAFEAADRLASGLALAGSTFDVVVGGLMAAGARDDDAVQRGIDPAIAAAVQALAPAVARAGRDGRDAGGAGELGRGGEALIRTRIV